MPASMTFPVNTTGTSPSALSANKKRKLEVDLDADSGDSLDAIEVEGGNRGS